MGIWQHTHTVTTTEVSPDLGDFTEILDYVSVGMIPLTGPEGPLKFLVFSWELAFYEISVASQNHVDVGHHQIAASGRDQ
jgi:hypothetical protein